VYVHRRPALFAEDDLGRMYNRMRTLVRQGVAFAWILSVCVCNAQPVPGVYPQGTSFPLLMLALGPDPALAAPVVAASGWNIGHLYIDPQLSDPTGREKTNSRLQTLAQNGMEGLVHLSANYDSANVASEGSEAQIADYIQFIVANTNIAYWDFPEEMRYWKASELQIVRDYAAWTRRYDPQRRPNFMYIPGHYSASDVAHYIPFLDIIPASAYADYAAQPHAWVRWRMEETIRGIHQGGGTIGWDYQRGEKTPVGIIQLFKGSNGLIPTPEQTYYDFWQLIVSGARGIWVYSYAHRNDTPSLLSNFANLQTAASQVSGEEQIGNVILYGRTDSSVTFTVLDGPDQTVSFTPYGLATAVQFPAIDLLCKVWHGDVYVIAVNSTDQIVRAEISGLPGTDGSATLPFESRTVAVTGDEFADVFPPWGVHVYRMRRQPVSRPRETPSGR